MAINRERALIAAHTVSVLATAAERDNRVVVASDTLLALLTAHEILRALIHTDEDLDQTLAAFVRVGYRAAIARDVLESSARRHARKIREGVDARIARVHREDGAR